MVDSKNTDFVPPQDMWEVNAKLNFDLPLDENDPRYVDTEKGRGKFSFNEMYRTLGIDSNKNEFRAATNKSYNLFCGHRGCGKTTELRRLAKELNKDNLFFVVFLDSMEELNLKNLFYPDLLLALAKKLLEKLSNADVKIDNALLDNLSDWFMEKISKTEKLNAFEAEVKAQVKMETGIPFFATLFAAMTTKIKNNATYKEEIREVVKNSFSEFADGFNNLIATSEKAVEKAGKGKKILFIIDGTDRLEKKDSERFFIEEVYQLQQIVAHFIYCAPIHLLYEGNQVQQLFNSFILPMIKIYPEQGSMAKFEEGYEVLRQILYLRADKKLFESEKVVDLLIANSGGNPRDLLKLLQYAHRKSESDAEVFKMTAVDEAIHAFAMDYRKFLDKEDYEILYKIDQGEDQDGSSDQIRRLLYNLAILEYNSGWWRAHPIIRHLEGYKKMKNAGITNAAN
ncbi:MAG TPA: hypothetical protein VK186_28265 [Candidatus Deferrimicrobium sp.]|nr:hypothetical protein [Candidatus Kapabacteria bacterium]HLP62766.1 hypothetical protein [Candidatus Deferrimicrobium sp.]